VKISRVDVHSGDVVGGIVGITKYIYDILGAAVNVAAGMEQHCEPMRINCSPFTFKMSRDFFDFEERVPLEIKGKGEMKIYSLGKTVKTETPSLNLKEISLP